jgi:hypothetical protein
MIRIAATLFLMLANLMWLAHAVVPHHHHDDHICFVTLPNHENHGHNHHSDGSDGCCSLKQTIATQTNTDKRIENDDDSSGKGHHHSTICIYNNCFNLSPGWIIVTDVIGHPPQFIPNSSIFFSAHGLRAPPFC